MKNAAVNNAIIGNLAPQGTNGVNIAVSLRCFSSFIVLVAIIPSDLKTIVIYTTRPIREGEQEGVEYYFVDEKRLAEFEAQGKVIELRAYNTVHGVWKYFTVDDGQFDGDENYIAIGTLESYAKMLAYMGAGSLVPIYIDVDDGVRLLRAVERERKQKEPKYEELCRRFLADAEDFSEENLQRMGITHHYFNDNMENCIQEIMLCIHQEI